MLFFGKSTERSTQQQEAERAQIERMKTMVRETLHDMRNVGPVDAERLHQRVKDLCTDKSLPMDFKRKALEMARGYECNANMRATDKLLHDAIKMAAGEHMKERAQKLSEARKLFSKACTLGADDDFRKAANRLMDTIMMTGGIVHPGPTRAKPKDFAPKAPNRAKW